MIVDMENIKQFYSSYPEKVSKLRKQLGRPLTFAEKILGAHQSFFETCKLSTLEGLLSLLPDRIALRDVSSQLSLLQFASSGRNRVSVPTSVHCDHLIQAEIGAKEDILRAHTEHAEVFNFLQESCRKYGIDFWKLGSGVIHQVLLENYAFPGGLMIGTDAYLPNAGGLGMMAMAASASEIVGAMACLPYEIVCPRLVAVHLTASLSGWACAKDVALQLLDSFPLKGANGAIIEFIGEGAASLSCTGKATICNLLCEAGAFSVVFPYDTPMADYLTVTHREEIAILANTIKDELAADSEIIQDLERYFSRIIEIDLSTVEPRISGPNGSEKSWPISEFAFMMRQSGFPEKISVCMIGSCVNSSYEDMQRAASIARQAWKHGLKVKSSLFIAPGSERVRSKVEQEGVLKAFEEIGAVQFASACGPCAGLWKRHDVAFGEKNSILTTFNRGPSGRHDGNPGTHAFIASPEISVALAFAGRLTFNPLTDALLTAQGLPMRFTPPNGDALPKNGFNPLAAGCYFPVVDGLDVQISIDPDSKRLQLLKPFDPWNEREFFDMRPLVKATGKVLVDQIFPGGRWQRFRGHLENISESIFSGIGNAFRSEVGKGKNLLTSEIEPLSKIARDYKREGIGWVFIAEEACGEGNSCDITVMGPRFLGCKAVIAKSFNPSFEVGLKRQGVLALTFTRWEDFTRIREDDLLDIAGLREFCPDSILELLVKHADGTTEKIPLKHTYTSTQTSWFKAGSALNAMRP